MRSKKAILALIFISASITSGGEIMYIKGDNPAILKYPAGDILQKRIKGKEIIECIVPQNTKVEILDVIKDSLGGVYYKVRVLEGYCKGKEGYVGAPYLSRY